MTRPIRHILVLLLLLFLLLRCFGCKDPGRFEPAPVPPGDYRRIVSLTPSITEILFAMGAADRVAGVTTWCDYPEAARRLPRVGDFIKPNIEAVLSLEPDLVILAPTGTLLKKSYDNLAALGLPVLVIWNNTLEETFDAIQVIGSTLSMEREAAVLAEGIRASLDSEVERLEGIRKKRVLWVVGHRPLIAVGEGSYQADLLETAGGINVVPSGLGAWPNLNEEFVLKVDPEVIIDAAMGGEFEQGELRKSWERFSSVRAVRNERVHFVHHDALYRPGPRAGEALGVLVRILHPERDP